MTSFCRLGLRAALAGLLLVGGVWNTAQAQLTPAGQPITNRAIVDYSVGGQPQTFIESSPTGNSIPDTDGGADTVFVVDQVVDLTVSAVDTAAVTASPGAPLEWVTFTVTNDGNEDQGYLLTVTEEVDTSADPFGAGNADNFDINPPGSLNIFVDEGPLGGGGGDGLFSGTTELDQDYIATLAPGETITVFVLADIQTANNLVFANINLDAQTAIAGTTGIPADVQQEYTETVLDPLTVVEVIFGDEDDPQGTNYDGRADATSQFGIESAVLTVTKTAEVIADPFNTVAPFLAVPGATVEYTIVIANTGPTAAADVAITDTLPADTSFVVDAYGASNVLITDGAVPNCVADGDAGDSCVLAGGDLIVGAAAIGSIAALTGTVTVQFQVLID